MRKPPSLKPQPQPRPQVVRPSGDQVIRGEDGQVYVVVQDGTALPGGPQPRGSRTGPGPQVGQIIKGQDGRLYEVVHVIPGHGGSPVSTGGLFGSGEEAWGRFRFNHHGRVILDLARFLLFMTFSQVIGGVCVNDAYLCMMPI